MLALVAMLLIIAFDGSVTRLIQLYILGVFTSFTLSQAGMVRHWNRALAVTVARSDRGGSTCGGSTSAVLARRSLPVIPDELLAHISRVAWSAGVSIVTGGHGPGFLLQLEEATSQPKTNPRFSERNPVGR